MKNKKLKIVAQACKILICPTIYETKRRTFIVVGRRVGPKIKEMLSISKGEDAVEIPKILINKLSKNAN